MATDPDIVDPTPAAYWHHDTRDGSVWCNHLAGDKSACSNEGGEWEPLYRSSVIGSLRSELAAEKARTATLEALLVTLLNADDATRDELLLAEARTEVPR
jgi:hypothetical protein